MTGTDILATLNTPNLNMPAAGTNYKPLRSSTKDDDDADFTMVMTAKISTSVQEISAKQANGSISVTASSRTVRAEVFSVSTNARSTSLSNQNTNIKNLSAADSANAAGKDVSSLSKDDLNRIGKALGDFKTGVNDVLKKELGVTDEDIENAMETLGLSYLDLTDTNALAQLMMQLLGNDFDAASLLSLQNFSDIKNAVNDLAQDLFQATGLSASQLTAVDEFLTATEEGGIDISDMTPSDGSGLSDLDLSGQEAQTKDIATDGNTAQTETASAAETPVTAQDTDPAAAAAETEAPASSDEVTEILPDHTADSAATDAQPTADADMDAAALTDDTAPAEETVELTAPAEEQAATDKTDNLSDLSDDSFAATKNMGSENPVKTAASQNSQNQGAQNSENQNNAFNMNQPTQAPVGEMRAAAPEVPVSYTTAAAIDTRDILSQMATGIRTAITERATTMELNLNPENLGKMSIRVTSEDGQVNAHVALENENVRTTMETQMGILKANLEAQGIKVNEVTVTADAHQFERNLEEGQAADMTGAEGGNQGGFRNEEEERRHGGRIGNLDMRSLDAEGLSNLTEDERLAAQIMRDKGNTISINA